MDATTSDVIYWDKGADMEESDWEQEWKEGNTGFQMPTVHSTLVKYYDQLVASKGSDVSFLLPLCGKSHDMKWLADKGHNVVGAEFAELPCKVFFDEQGLKYDTTPMEGVSDGFLHKSDDGKIKFFQSDFFKFTKSHAGVFDVIWDRASLVAINKKDREKYVDKIISLLKPDGVCMLESLVYEGSFRGPPHNISIELVKELYGNSFTVNVLEENDILSDPWKNSGVTAISSVTVLLRLK